MNGHLSSASSKAFVIVVDRTCLLPVNVGSFRSLVTSPKFLFLPWDSATRLMSQTSREVNHIPLKSCERQNLEFSLITLPFSLLLFTLLPLQGACWCWAESVNGFLGTDQWLLAWLLGGGKSITLLIENSMLCYNTYYVPFSLRSCLEVVTTLELTTLNMGHVGWNLFVLNLGA